MVNNALTRKSENPNFRITEAVAVADRKGQGPGRAGVAQMRTPTGLFFQKKHGVFRIVGKNTGFVDPS